MPTPGSMTKKNGFLNNHCFRTLWFIKKLEMQTVLPELNFCQLFSVGDLFLPANFCSASATHITFSQSRSHGNCRSHGNGKVLQYVSVLITYAYLKSTILIVALNLYALLRMFHYLMQTNYKTLPLPYNLDGESMTYKASTGPCILD